MIFKSRDRGAAESDVHAHMEQQYGLVKRQQALDAGMSEHQIGERLRLARWVRAARRVYRHAAVPSTPESRLLARCMAYEALASHRSAAALHGIDGYKLDKVEVVVAKGRVRRIPGARLHHSTQMRLAGRVERHGIPCTQLDRTVLDLAGLVDRAALDRAIDAVLRKGLLRMSDLWRVLASHSKPGRTGCVALRNALQARSGEGGVPLSDWSRMVADLLESSGLPRPVFEHRVEGRDGEFVAQVDLAYPSVRLAIELDSVGWHFNLESFVKDPRRRNTLFVAGWDVLTFTWDDYVNRPGHLCSTVSRARERIM